MGKSSSTAATQLSEIPRENDIRSAITSAPSNAPGYHAQLRSAGNDPADISIGFQREARSGNDNIDATAKNVQISVKKNGLDPSTPVTARWSDFDHYGKAPTVEEVPLTYHAASQSFVGTLPDTAISHVYAEGPSWTDYDQSLGVDVGGKPLMDPVSGEPQFSLNLSKAFEAQSGKSDASMDQG